MAFAARVQPASAPIETSIGQHRNAPAHLLASPVSALAKKPVEPQDVPEPLGKDILLPHSTLSTPALSHTEESAPAAESTAATAKMELPTTEQAGRPKALEPLKDLSIQVARPGNDRVEVRLTQQAGELHVAVRTGDADFAHGLREGLPDLVGRLQESGFRAETWKPAGAIAAAGAPAETQNTPSNSSGGGFASNSGGPRQESNHHNQQQSDRPRWVEELETSMNSGGNRRTHGFANQRHHQPY
jgi:hypothetical protein